VTSVLLNNRREPVARIRQALLDALDRHRQTLEPGDDITFLLVKRNP